LATGIGTGCVVACVNRASVTSAAAGKNSIRGARNDCVTSLQVAPAWLHVCAALVPVDRLHAPRRMEASRLFLAAVGRAPRKYAATARLTG
jgi:hypothetical protein